MSRPRDRSAPTNSRAPTGVISFSTMPESDTSKVLVAQQPSASNSMPDSVRIQHRSSELTGITIETRFGNGWIFAAPEELALSPREIAEEGVVGLCGRGLIRLAWGDYDLRSKLGERTSDRIDIEWLLVLSIPSSVVDCGTQIKAGRFQFVCCGLAGHGVAGELWCGVRITRPIYRKKMLTWCWKKRKLSSGLCLGTLKRIEKLESPGRFRHNRKEGDLPPCWPQSLFFLTLRCSKDCAVLHCE